MKRILQTLALLVFVVALQNQVTVAAQTQQQCCAKQTILKSDDAVLWAKQHVGELVDNYLASCGNKLDPDELRKQLAPIGYDGTNVPDYRAAEKLLVDTVYRRMMQMAISNGNSSIMMLTGPGASGKSTTTKKLDFSGYGLLYDSAFNSYSSLKKAVDKAISAGMTDITVMAFYNDIETCYRNSINRGKATNRFLGVGYLTNAFRSNQDKIKMLRKEYPNVKVLAYDNNHNNGGIMVSADEAEKWDFSIDAETLNHILVLILNEIYTEGITGSQITSAAGDIDSVVGLDDTGKALATEIARQVSKRTQH